MKTTLLPILAAASLLALGTSAHAQLINGGFETGDFTGWTFFQTTHGGLGQPQVVSYTTVNHQPASPAAQFEVGVASGPIPSSQGGGISQNVLLGAGQLNISLDIATAGPGANSDGGTFELLLDGNDVASHAFGSVAPNQEQSSTLNYTGAILAGTHSIAIEMLRNSANQVGETPYEYVDNVVLSGSAVPEPSVGSLLAAGLAAALFVLSRQPGMRNA
jgi:hypothetical protein